MPNNSFYIFQVPKKCEKNELHQKVGKTAIKPIYGCFLPVRFRYGFQSANLQPSINGHPHQTDGAQPYGDSHGAIFNAQNPVTQKGIKHIEIHYHYIREQIEKGEVKVFTVPMTENVADMFTKNLGLTLFLKHRKQLGIEFYPL